MSSKTLMFMMSVHGHQLSEDLWNALSSRYNLCTRDDVWRLYSPAISGSECNNPQVGYDCFQHKQLQASFVPQI